MTQFLVASSYTLHALATVIFIGYFLLMSLIHLPVLSNTDIGAGMALGEINKHSRPWMYASLIIFILTGVYLMVVDPNYLGIGNFSNPWAILMLVKHVLILGMVGIGFWYNFIVRVGRMLRSTTGAEQGIVKYRMYSNMMAVCGVVVLLLTAVAQVR